MENEAGIFALVKMVDGMLMFLRREFAIMWVLENGRKWHASSVGRWCSDCSAGIAENGGKNSVQDFGSCSLFSHLPIGHTRTKEQGMPGNQIRC